MEKALPRELNCSECGRIVEFIGEDVTAVVCHICCAHKGPVMAKQQINDGPRRARGWKFMNEYVDTDGNVFHRGVEQPKLKGKFPPTPAKPKMSQFERQQKKEEKQQRLARRYERKQEKLKHK